MLLRYVLFWINILLVGAMKYSLKNTLKNNNYIVINVKKVYGSSPDKGLILTDANMLLLFCIPVCNNALILHKLAVKSKQRPSTQQNGRKCFEWTLLLYFLN